MQLVIGDHRRQMVKLMAAILMLGVLALGCAAGDDPDPDPPVNGENGDAPSVEYEPPSLGDPEAPIHVVEYGDFA